MNPVALNTRAISADELAFSKNEKEETFFEVGSTIPRVYAKTEYFSRDKA